MGEYIEGIDADAIFKRIRNGCTTTKDADDLMAVWKAAALDCRNTVDQLVAARREIKRLRKRSISYDPSWAIRSKTTALQVELTRIKTELRDIRWLVKDCEAAAVIIPWVTTVILAIIILVAS